MVLLSNKKKLNNFSFAFCRPSLLWQKLQIWDTAGQERFRSITQSYYRSANALILTYDITCEESFRCLPEWLREIEQYASNKVITVLVGKAPQPLTLREVCEGASSACPGRGQVEMLAGGKPGISVTWWCRMLGLVCWIKGTALNPVLGPLLLQITPGC